MTNLFAQKKTHVLEYTHQPIAETHRLYSAWEDELKAVNPQTLTPQDFTFAHKTFNLWLSANVLERPAIVAAPPGFGKSTMLKVYLRDRVRNDSTFGAIVVKERLTDLEELAAYINEEQPDEELTVRNQYAYFIRGYDEEVISREDYEAQFTVQANFPIVLMTTKQFELQTLKDNLISFSAYRDEGGNKRPRRTLMIDEKPSLTIPYRLTGEEINGLMGDIRAASLNATPKVKRSYKRIRDHVNALRDRFEDPDISGVERVMPVDRHFIIPHELLAQFAAVHNLAKLSRLRALEYLVNHGGLMSSMGGRVVIQTSRKLHYEWTQFNAFILDGTGGVDPEYGSDEFVLIEPEHKPDYSNVTFHVCDRYSLSKSAIAADYSALGKIASECKAIAARHEGEVLIVTYKTYTDELQRRLAEEIGAGKIRVKHFDGGRGSNAYMNADTAIYIGLLNKGSLYYPTTAQAAVGDQEGVVLSPEYHVGKKGLVYTDEIVEGYKRLDMAVNMVQETNRLRANRKVSPVNFYVFSKDERVVEQIARSYDGCKVASYSPAEKLTGKKTSDDNIRDYLISELKPGESVKQSEVYRALGIDRRTLYSFITNEKTEDFLASNGITKVKTRFFKDEI